MPTAVANAARLVAADGRQQTAGQTPSRQGCGCGVDIGNQGCSDRRVSRLARQRQRRPVGFAEKRQQTRLRRRTVSVVPQVPQIVPLPELRGHRELRPLVADRREVQVSVVARFIG